MRVLIFIAAVLSASAAFAGVEVKDGKMSADITGLPLRQVLQTIKQNTKIHFSMDDEIAGLAVSANFQDLTVAAGIKKLLEGTGINYVVMADANGDPTSIFLGKSEKAGAPPKKLDSRPVTIQNRGVVQPIQPIQPVQPQGQPQQNQRPNNRQAQPPANNNKPAGMGTTTEVPTGGTLVAPTPPQVQQPVDGESRANPDNNNATNDDDEEDDNNE